MSTHAANGKAALESSDHKAALNHLTLALQTNPAQPLWLIQRASAYQRLSQFDLALIDAENAVLAARARAKRELIVDAQFRRAVALRGLGRYGDARLCLTYVRKMDEKYKQLGIWQQLVVNDYEKAGGEEASANQTTIKEIPDKHEDVVAVVEQKKEPEKQVVKEDKGKGSEVKATPVVTSTSKEQIRHEFYQSTDKLTITIFAKGVPKDKGEVIIKEGSLEISFPVDSSSTYNLSFNPLFSRVDTLKSSYRITSHKIEILLHKSLPGLKWPSLEGDAPIPISASTIDENRKPIPAAVLQKSAEKPPSYPTSSKNGPKNWDSVVSTEEFEEGGDDVNNFFKKLYDGADDDTKKAMMKSMQESNGTSLSTNWADVKKGPVETHPPDGVEAKKWT